LSVYAEGKVYGFLFDRLYKTLHVTVYNMQGDCLVLDVFILSSAQADTVYNLFWSNIMRTIPVNLYTFDELSGKAKEKALQELYFAAEYPWHDENRDTLKAIEKAFKLERFDWGYDACHYSFSFEVPHDLKQGMGKKAINRLFSIYLDDGFWLTEFFKADFWKSFNHMATLNKL